MRKIIILIISLLVITILFLLLVLIINNDSGKGALQVTSSPNAEVFLNGKSVGKTPICLCELSQLLKAEDYDIKLVPEGKDLRQQELKVKIYGGVLTVVDRTFDKETAVSSGSLITLSPIDDKKDSQLLIVSFPEKAEIIMDSVRVGATPLLLKNVTASDHEIKILKDGYGEKIIKVKTILGKRLEATINLGIKMDISSGQLLSTPSGELSSTVVVQNTPTGYLRVRESNTVDSAQIATVSPGDSLTLLEENQDWYKVKLSDGKIGWISSSYAVKE